MITDIPEQPKVSVVSRADAVKYVADRLRLARRIRNMTLENMASHLGITRTQLQHYENAQTNITITRLWEISKLLNIETGFFVEGLGISQPLLNNEELELVHKFKTIKNKRAKASLLGILKEL